MSLLNVQARCAEVFADEQISRTFFKKQQILLYFMTVFVFEIVVCQLSFHWELLPFPLLIFFFNKGNFRSKFINIVFPLVSTRQYEDDTRNVWDLMEVYVYVMCRLSDRPVGSCSGTE